MVQPVNLLAVATAVPPHKLEQTAVTAAARHAYARTFARYPKLADVFVNIGRDSRYSVGPPEGPREPHNLAERTNVYLESASELFVRTARAALDQAGISATEGEAVGTGSSTRLAE